MRHIIILATGLTLISALPAGAAEPYLPRNAKAFERIDANKDGKIKLEEFTPLAERGLNKLDANGDKQVTAQEIESKLQQQLHRRVERMMQVLDTDKNGVITAAELDNVAADMFNSADSDKDGGLTMAEAHDFKRGVWRKAVLARTASATGSGN